jgi:hypothetical protein
MRPSRPALLIALLAACVCVAVPGGWGLLAQEQAGPKRIAPEISPVRGSRVSLDEAMTRPFTFPFRDETTLESVVKLLQKELGANVVLDLAGLRRAEIVPEDHVKLDLKDVRLKTGLKLLLDQVGLTYKIVLEDNLLIITDERGTEDPTTRILLELKELHRDIHNLQDSVEDLSRSIVPVEENPAVRKPTIIEEMPAEKGQEKPKDKGKTDEPVGRTRPGL